MGKESHSFHIAGDQEGKGGVVGFSVCVCVFVLGGSVSLVVRRGTSLHLIVLVYQLLVSYEDHPIISCR